MAHSASQVRAATTSCTPARPRSGTIERLADGTTRVPQATRNTLDDGWNARQPQLTLQTLAARPRRPLSLGVELPRSAAAGLEIVLQAAHVKRPVEVHIRE